MHHKTDDSMTVWSSHERVPTSKLSCAIGYNKGHYCVTPEQSWPFFWGGAGGGRSATPQASSGSLAKLMGTFGLFGLVLGPCGQLSPSDYNTHHISTARERRKEKERKKKEQKRTKHERLVREAWTTTARMQINVQADVSGPGVCTNSTLTMTLDH